MFIALIVGAALLGGLFGITRSSTYMAETLILLNESRGGSVFGSLSQGSDSDTDVFLNDQVAVMTSTTLALQVAGSLGMEPTLEAAEALLDDLTVTPVEDSHALTVSFASDEPAKSIETVNAFVTAYEEAASVALNGPYVDAIAALDGAITETEASVEALRTEISDEIAAATVDLREQRNEVLARMDQITEALPGADAATRTALIAELDALSVLLSSLESRIASAGSSPSIEARQSRLDSLSSDLDQFRARRSQLMVDSVTAASPIIARSEASTASSLAPGPIEGAVAGGLVGLLLAFGIAYWRATADPALDQQERP